LAGAAGKKRAKKDGAGKKRAKKKMVRAKSGQKKSIRNTGVGQRISTTHY
jgi:hypothetical protein